MTRSPLSRLALPLALAAVPTAASAQRVVTEPVLDVGVQLEVRHDTNVVRASDQLADRRGLEQSDTRLRPALTITAARPIGPHSVSLNGLIGYDIYRRNGRLDRERILVNGDGLLNLRQCELGLNAALNRQQGDLLDTIILVNDVAAAIDNTQTLQTYGAQLSCGSQIGIRPTVGIERRIGDNSNPLRQRVDFRSTRYLAGLGYRQPSIGDALVFVSRQDTDFPNSLLNPGGGFEVRRYGGRLSRDIGARLRGTVEIAYAEVGGGGIIGNNYDGITYSAALTAVVSPRLQLDAEVARDVGSNLGNDSAYTLSERYGVNAAYAVNPRLTLTGGALVAPQRFFFSNQLTPGLGLGLGQIDDFTLTRVVAGASYLVGRRLRFTLDSGYERRSAAGDLFDFNNVFIATGVRLAL